MPADRSNQNEWIALGRFGRAKGLAGQVYLDAFNPDSDFLASLDVVGVGEEGQEIQTARLREVQRSSARWVLKLDLASTREDAERLTHRFLYARRQDFPALPRGQFYHFEIIGFGVRTPEGQDLGRLRAIEVTPSNEIYVVEGPDGEIDLPNIPGVIQSIDADSQTIIARVPETLDAF